MAKSTSKGRDPDDSDYLRLAATRLTVPGASVRGRRLFPDDGYVLEEDREQGVIFLKDQGGGPGVSISCECGLEGGGCVPIVINPGDIDEYGACVPESGCGSSGLFCFMGFDFGGGLAVKVQM
jgi:hypothetical protein